MDPNFRNDVLLSGSLRTGSSEQLFVPFERETHRKDIEDLKKKRREKRRSRSYSSGNNAKKIKNRSRHFPSNHANNNNYCEEGEVSASVPLPISCPASSESDDFAFKQNK